MIPLSTGQLLPLFLPWETGKDGQPLETATRFEAKAASVLERQLFEAEVASPPWNAREVFPWEWADEAGRAVAQLAQVDDRDRLTHVIALHRTGQLTDEADRQLWAGLGELLDQSWPAWQALKRRQETRDQILPTLACQWFLRRKGGEALPLGTDGKLTDEALRGFDFLELQALGRAIYRSLYGWEQAKNSDGPSPSGGGPKTSRKRAASGSATRAGKPSTTRSRNTRR